MYVDGLPFGGNPIKTDFSITDGTAIIRAYTYMLEASGRWRYNEGNALNRYLFIDGSSLIVFQLDPNFNHHGEYMTLLKNGNVRLEVQFRKALTGKNLLKYTLQIFLCRTLKDKLAHSL